MGRKSIFLISLFILFVLSLGQILFDYSYEKELSQSTVIPDKEEYLIFIDAEDKTLYLLHNGNLMKSFPVATGKSGYPSPLGCWKIVDKGDWGEGFGGYWMGLNVPWGQYGTHVLEH